MTAYLCDSNVWIALAVEKHLHHDPASEWLAALEEPDSVLFCRSTQQSFLRLLTSAAVLEPYELRPMTNDEAWSAYEALLEDDRIVFRAEEPPRLELAWARFARRPTASPRLWMDAYLAAFARSGGHTLVTTDRAFRQFEGLDLLLLGEA